MNILLPWTRLWSNCSHQLLCSANSRTQETCYYRIIVCYNPAVLSAHGIYLKPITNSQTPPSDSDFDLQRQIKLKFILWLGRYSWFENKIKHPQFPWQLIPVANCFLIPLCQIFTLLNPASRYWPVFSLLIAFPPSYHPSLSSELPSPLLGSWISPQ